MPINKIKLPCTQYRNSAAGSIFPLKSCQTKYNKLDVIMSKIASDFNILEWETMKRKRPNLFFDSKIPAFIRKCSIKRIIV